MSNGLDCQKTGNIAVAPMPQDPLVEETTKAVGRSARPDPFAFPNSEAVTALMRAFHPGDANAAFSVDARMLDRVFHAMVARQTGGISPIGLWLAGLDWAAHLAASPGKQMEISEKALSAAYQFQQYALHCALGDEETAACAKPAPSDRRFSSADWQSWPFNLIYQGFLLQEQLLEAATTGVRGATNHHERVANFCARQALDMLSPSNFLPTNPEVLRKTVQEGGQNLVRGWANFLEDLGRYYSGQRPAGMEQFRVGESLAVTPGKVVARNELMELIQYSAATDAVHPEPVLITPAWIMKYYVLDLSPHNSLVKYLVDQGFTVFMISWKNPDPSYREYGLDDYRRLGIMTALDRIGEIVGPQRVNAVGYCLGGTLLSMAAAAMARDGDDRLNTMTLLAAQTDFTEPGELDLFVSESQLAFMEDMMEEQGVLEGQQMAATFQLLRSNDLIWSRWLHDYLMGERHEMFDLMAWNADATRMPARMHSEYLRKIYLENQLAQGRYLVDGRPVALRDIETPIFSVATERDHVAPWKSVYKLHLLTDAPVTFLLTSGGHNAGIVSEPGHGHRAYRVATWGHDDVYVDPESWVPRTPVQPGSWWPEWQRWLAAHSSTRGLLPPLGAALTDAPGTYVFE